MIKKFQVCAVRGKCIGNLSKENIWLQRRKMEKVLEDNEDIICFLRALLLWWKRRIQKQGGGELIRKAVRKMEKNPLIIIVALLSGLCLIGLNMAFRHLQNIYLEFLTAEFDLISRKAIRSRGKLTILYLFIVNTVTAVVCSIVIYLPLIQVISIFQNFLGKSNKSPLDATAQSLFIVLTDHKSVEGITLTRDSYENVV